MCAALGLTEGRIEGRMLHPEVSGRGQSLRFPGEPLPGQASRFTRPAMPSEDAEGPARVTGTAPARAPGLSALAARGKAWDAAGAGALLPRPVGGSHVPGASESRGDLHLRVTFSATTPTRNQPCSHCGPRPPLPAGGGGGQGAALTAPHASAGGANPCRQAAPRPGVPDWASGGSLRGPPAAVQVRGAVGRPQPGPLRTARTTGARRRGGGLPQSQGPARLQGFGPPTPTPTPSVLRTAASPLGAPACAAKSPRQHRFRWGHTVAPELTRAVRCVCIPGHPLCLPSATGLRK